MTRFLWLTGIISFFLVFESLTGNSAIARVEENDPPEVKIGERLFKETRLGQYYYAQAGDDLNQGLAHGDPAVDFVLTLGQAIPNPYRGKGINCASCHFVDELQSAPGGGSRNYSDFARKSPIPWRNEDRFSHTPRNSPTMVDSTVPRKNGVLLHYDGEFSSSEGLARGTLLGRNFGWLPTEAGVARAHIAKVMKEDQGLDDLARETGGSYRKILKGTDPSIPEDLRLPEKYRIDVNQKSDQHILDAVAKLIGAYMDSLLYERNEQGENTGSPYDRFLEKNHLPRKPMEGETSDQYADRLLIAVETLATPKWVRPSEGELKLHEQEFEFGARELEGMKVFLRRAPSPPFNRNLNRRAGNCVACHTPPLFTDFSFHNIGVSQEEYDQVHGQGQFNRMFIPNYFERKGHEGEFLPASEAYPKAQGQYRKTASRGKKSDTDLGVWNILGNPSVPDPQITLKNQLCKSWFPGVGNDCKMEILLPKAIAAFKTPSLRDLGHSAPYMHNGSRDTLEEVMQFYIEFPNRARMHQLRNGDPELERVFIDFNDVDPIVAFLKSLNEDYQ
jgi:cytochrome c peroxidase